MKAVKAYVFDLDGTILDTMPDLAIAANEAFGQMGFPMRTQDELLDLMGFGGRYLIQRAVPPSASPEQAQETFEIWRSLYIASDYAHTAPFPGVVDALVQLRSRGAKTAVLSNKFHEGVRVLSARHFPGLFDAVRGDAPPVPRKPDPTSLLQILDVLNASPDEAAYIGDTPIDVETARNAGVMAIGVSWGYDKAAPLNRDDLDAYIHDPAELLSFLPDDE